MILTPAICSQDLDFIKNLLSSSVHEEVRHWSIEGSTTDDIDCINPTLIRPFVDKWKINNYASPFEGYMPFTKADIQRCKSLTAVCKETLTLWMKHFQQFKQLHPIKVNMWNGDGLWLCTSGLPSDLLFDVIDTSNISDHIGLLNVLVCCTPRLKRPHESQLQTSSMLCWEGECDDMENYYNKCIGINTNLLPTILGLHLAVDLDMGNRRIPDDYEETLYWVKASTDRTRLTIDKESDVITALWNLTKRCFNLIKDHESYCCGTTLSSPLTLLRIIHQMHPLIEGGASRIMDLLENELPYDFYQEHGFSWKLLKSIASQDGEPILQIQVQLRLNVTEEGKRLYLIPMIVFLKNTLLDLLKGFRGCPVLYNSLRFNIQEGHVTFHMLEKDWEIGKAKFLLQVVNNQKSRVFVNKPVDLEDDSVFDVQRVDPVATFGLFAVQEFNICDSSSPLLKLLKVQEENDSYKAEFAILDPVKCNAKDMTTQFTPESSPTEIKVNFQRETGSTMRFSCPVEASSNFQISKKQASVVCQIRKKDNYVSGEMALINPSQVPFHAMSLWDSKQDDMTWTCAKMYRENLPKLLAQREMGHPFLELRCLIKEILQKQINEQDPAICEISLNMHEGTNWKKGLIIKVLSPVYKWNNLPYAKCTFYDYQHAGNNLKDPTKVTQSLIPEFLGCSFNNVVAKQEPEIEMIRRTMYINAARTDQKNAITSDWKDSFICPLYARENLYYRSPEKMLGVPQTMEGLFSQLSINKHECCAFCQKPYQNLKKCTRCKKVSYCNRSCQEKHWKKGHKVECFGGSSSEGFPSQQREFPGRTTDPKSLNTETNEPFPSQRKEPEDRNNGLNSAPNRKPNGLDRCAFCQKPSENLKKCTRCGKVAYCNPDCQAQNWKKGHKNVCRASFSKQLPSQLKEPEGRKEVLKSLKKDPNELDQCAFCRKPSENLKKCTRCKKVSYCNQDCQAQHWKNKHRDDCLVDSSFEEFPSQQGQFPGRTTVPKSLNTVTNEPFPSQQKEPEDRNKGLNSVPNTETYGLCQCAFCRKPSENLKKCTRCKKVSYCNQDCQAQHWKMEHKSNCPSSASEQVLSENKDSFGAARSDALDRCAFCHKASEDLKQCTRCKKVSYCNQDCQAQHWKKEHKSN